MSKIFKKLSASLILILMIFSVAYNVLDYGYKVYAASSDVTTIESIKFTGNTSTANTYDISKENQNAKLEITLSNINLNKYSPSFYYQLYNSSGNMISDLDVFGFDYQLRGNVFEININTHYDKSYFTDCSYVKFTAYITPINNPSQILNSMEKDVNIIGNTSSETKIEKLEFIGNTQDNKYDISSSNKTVTMKITASSDSYSLLYDVYVYYKDNHYEKVTPSDWFNVSNSQVGFTVTQNISYKDKEKFENVSYITWKYFVTDESGETISSKDIIMYITGNETETGTRIITSDGGKIQLTILNEMVGGEYLTESGWRQLLNRYEGYYNQLANLTGYDPVATKGHKILMDFTVDEIPANGTDHSSGNPAANSSRGDLIIRVEKTYINKIAETNNSLESTILLHEFCHLFQNNQDWMFDTEITAFLEMASICNKRLNYISTRTYDSCINLYETQKNTLPTENPYKVFYEIAYIMLTETSTATIDSVIRQNNDSSINTSSTIKSNKERAKKFLEDLNEKSGKDIGEIVLSNGKTIYEQLGVEKTENISEIMLKQGNKTIIDDGEIPEDAEIDWNSDEKITLEFKLAKEEKNLQVELDGYISKYISNNNKTYKYEFEKDEIKPGTEEITLTISDTKNGTTNIENIPIINTGEDQEFIKSIEGKLESDEKYYIYVTLEEDRNEKYDIEWCKEHITIENEKLQFSEAQEVTENSNAIRFEVTNSTDDEIAGKSFKVKAIAKEDSKEIDSKTETIKIEKAFEEYSLIITNEANIESAKNHYGTDYKYGETTSELHFASGENFWKTTFTPIDNNKKTNGIFCIAKGKHMQFKEEINLFNAKDITTNISKHDMYALIYLNEIAFTTNEGQANENGDYYAVQAYIWMSKQLNEGVPLSESDIEESYRPFIEKANIAANEAEENDGILTLHNGKKVKVTEFSATKFEWEMSVSTDFKKVYHVADERQPYITFDYELTDGDVPPSIRLQKVDEQGYGIPGAGFIIYKANEYDKVEDRTWKKIHEEIVEQGISQLIEIKAGGEYLIIENKAPEEYTPSIQYAILTISEDGKTYNIDIYEATEEDALDENGCVKGHRENREPIAHLSGTLGTNDDDIFEESDWSIGTIHDPEREELIETEETAQLILELTNKQKPGIQLQKVDEDGEPLEGAEFTINEYDETSEVHWKKLGEYTTKNEGLTSTIILKPGQYLIRETQVPDETYIPSKQYIILQIYEDGRYEGTIYETTHLDNNGYVNSVGDATEIGTITGTLGEDAVIDETGEIDSIEWSTGEISENILLALILENKEEPGTGITLKKVDENGEIPEAEAIFSVYIDNNGKWEEYIPNGRKTNEYTTNIETGETRKKIPTSVGERYLIVESKAPEGYEPTTQYAIVEMLEDGSYETHVYKASEDCIEDGYINVEKINGIEITAESNEKFEWNDEETVEETFTSLQLTVENKSKTPSIKLQKVDETGNPIVGKGGKFKITVTNQYGEIIYQDSEGKELNEYGERELKFKNKNAVYGNTYTVTLQETEAPEGYDIVENGLYEFKIKFTKEGKCEIIENNIDSIKGSVTINDKTIQVVIINAKKKDLELQIKKIDGSTNEPIIGAHFTLQIDGLLNKTSLDSKKNGYSELIEIKKENLKPGMYTATLTEAKLNGYREMIDTTFYIIIDEIGGIHIGPCTNDLVEIQTSSSDEKVTILLIIKNYKEVKVTFPVLMTISGKVWLDEPSGKNSETNGTYDEGNDKLLSGIEVSIYEASGNPVKFANKEDVMKSMQNSLVYLSSQQRNKITDSLENIPPNNTNVVITNEKGEFKFGGLDPDLIYTIKFKYNGMRYSEITASVNVEGCGTPESVISTTTSKAKEIKEQRDALTKRFSEIGPYPNNYYDENGQGHLAFTQTEVEQYLQGKKKGNIVLPNGVEESEMTAFIENTMIEAEITGIGGILKDAEEKLKSDNKKLGESVKDDPSKKGIESEFVFPVIKKSGIVEQIKYEARAMEITVEFEKKLYPTKTYLINTGENSEVQKWIKKFMDEKYKNSDWVGYELHKMEIQLPCFEDYLHFPHNGSKVISHMDGPKFHHDEGIYQSFIKERIGSTSTPIRDVISTCGAIIGYNPDGTPRRCGDLMGEQKTYYGPTEIKAHNPPITLDEILNNKDIKDSIEDSYYAVYVYYVDEGYSPNVIEEEKYHTRYAVFDLDNEPLFDNDESIGKKGKIDKNGNTHWGWDCITDGIDDNDIEDSQLGNEGIGKLYGTLWREIENNPRVIDQDLCVVYRPTVDLGLHNDVQRAILTISGGGKETRVNDYIYDKKLANGGIFKFGVNEYDIENTSSKSIQQVEEEYENYYNSLSEGNPDPGENNIEQKEYDPLKEREEDIIINTGGEGASTKNGEAIAGYNIDHDVKIELIYKVKIFNEAAVTARVTNILDYYDEDFTFEGIYSDAECNNKLSLECTDYSSSTMPDGYKAKNINLSDIVLEGNKSHEIYIKLVMDKSFHDPKDVLPAKGFLTEDGYKTCNYAEINGYGTNIGVIDIDSSPGDLVPEGRFEGTYDDDESKSPTLIFKIPDEGSRTITGKVYEDETGMNINTAGSERPVTGSSTPVIGAIVKLIEVDANGNPLSSGQAGEEEPGFRAKTLTKEDGTYTFSRLTPGYYKVVFEYGSNYSTVLINSKNYNIDERNDSSYTFTNIKSIFDYDLLASMPNPRSYNGQDYESVLENINNTDNYWYTNIDATKPSAADNIDRRNAVKAYAETLQNHNAEVFNSYKDSKVNFNLLHELIDKSYMYGETPKMLLEIEYVKNYPDQVVTTLKSDDANNKNGMDGYYENEYTIENVNFGIVERERAEIQITKNVSYISIVDSAGKKITGGSAEDIQKGNIKYIKMVPNAEEQGFVDMEIDKELLSGATLKVEYEIAVTNNSESSSRNPNTIQSIQVIDYVSNNLNFDANYGEDNSKWRTITTADAANYVNRTSLTAGDDNTANKIDLSTYQTILMTTFDSLTPGETKRRTLTLEKNLSSQEDSNFNYENQVEIVQSYNPTGRGDYSSIYGNLDPMTYTSRQGDLFWDPSDKTDTTVVSELGPDVITNQNAIRLAEKDSGNAEEVIITPPTGAKGIVLQNYHYVLALIALITLAGTIVLIKKYIAIPKE